MGGEDGDLVGGGVADVGELVGDIGRADEGAGCYAIDRGVANSGADFAGEEDEDFFGGVDVAGGGGADSEACAPHFMFLGAHGGGGDAFLEVAVH